MTAVIIQHSLASTLLQAGRAGDYSAPSGTREKADSAPSRAQIQKLTIVISTNDDQLLQDLMTL